MARLRHLGKRLLAPLVRPFLSQIDRRLQRVHDELDVVREQVRLLAETLPPQAAVVNETMSAIVEREIGILRDRLEVTRVELMYEIRYGGRAPGGVTGDRTEPRIVDRERMAGFGDQIRLNLGCGHIPLADFLNVDSRELDDVDIVADVHRLPFAAASVAQIHSAHLMEHFPVEELRRSLLPYWVSLLKPGGRFTAIVPDTETMIAEFSEGRISFDELRLVTFGQQEYDNDFHFNMFSRASIGELLEEAGLQDVRILETGRRNGVCYEMEIESRRSAERA